MCVCVRVFVCVYNLILWSGTDFEDFVPSSSPNAVVVEEDD